MHPGDQFTSSIFRPYFTLSIVYSMPITTDIVISNPSQVRCTTLCDKVCQWPVAGLWFSPGITFSSTNITDSHNIEVESGVKHHNKNHNQPIHSILVCIEMAYIYSWLALSNNHSLTLFLDI